MHKADNLPPSRVVTKSGSLNFLEPSGPVQACNGTVLAFDYNNLVMHVGMFLTRYDTSSRAYCFKAVVITVIVVLAVTEAHVAFRPHYYSPEFLLMDILKVLAPELFFF